MGGDQTRDRARWMPYDNGEAQDKPIERGAICVAPPSWQLLAPLIVACALAGWGIPPAIKTPPPTAKPPAISRPTPQSTPTPTVPPAFRETACSPDQKAATAAGSPPQSSTTTVNRPMGPYVTLAYLGPGVGVVATSDVRADTLRPRLYRTVDFALWTDVTPPASALSGDDIFENAYFLDAQTGWVTDFAYAAARASVYHTIDGGLSWQRVQGTSHTPNYGAITRMQFLTGSFGFMDTEQPTGPIARLSVTEDSGAHWATRSESRWEPQNVGVPVADTCFMDATRAIATVPASSCFEFVESPSSGVWFSVDGGRSWNQSTVPAGYVPTGEALTCFGAPLVSSSPSAWLPATTVTDKGSRVSFLASNDGGGRWDAAGTVPITFSPTQSQYRISGRAVPQGAMAPDGSWWALGVLPSGAPSAAVSTDEGQHWRTAASRGIIGQPQFLLARDARAAWALVGLEGSRQLYATSDGGDTWAPVDPAAGQSPAS